MQHTRRTREKNKEQEGRTRLAETQLLQPTCTHPASSGVASVDCGHAAQACGATAHALSLCAQIRDLAKTLSLSLPQFPLL